jgi:hypothetical protein
MFRRPASNSRNPISDSKPARPPAVASADSTSLALVLFQKRAKLADHVRTVAPSLFIKREMPARLCSVSRRTSCRRCRSLTSPFHVFGSPPTFTRHWDIESKVATKLASDSLTAAESSDTRTFCTALDFGVGSILLHPTYSAKWGRCVAYW